jgi:hypothetical protein
LDGDGFLSDGCQLLAAGQGISSQEYDRQVHATLAQLWEWVDAQIFGRLVILLALA